MKKKLNLDLNEDEKELSDSFDKGEWHSVSNLSTEIKLAKKIAKNTLLKDARINIKLTSGDLSRIKQKAAVEGIPYQTLISSVLHKFASGHPINSRKF